MNTRMELTPDLLSKFLQKEEPGKLAFRSISIVTAETADSGAPWTKSSIPNTEDPRIEIHEPSIRFGIGLYTTTDDQQLISKLPDNAIKWLTT